MDRFAVFVDAGYLYAGAGHRYFATGSRARLRIDFDSFTTQIVKIAADQCGLPHLRTYWYDAASGGMPTPAHLAIAHRQGVKLRLGRLTGSPLRQKGVDSRIVRDLITLARNRAIATAFVLSGDDDLSEGVIEAQEHGVHVTLVGVAALPGESNQSPRLVRETDAFLALEESMIRECMALRPDRESVSREVNLDDAHAMGMSYASQWLQVADVEQIDSLSGSMRPYLPKALNSGLIAWAEEQLGNLRGRDELKIALREGFWEGLQSEGILGNSQ